MRVKYDDLWACDDCTLYLANGDIPEERPNLADEIKAQWPDESYLMIGNETHEFSWQACDCCDSNLGGSRTLFAVLESEGA